MTAKSKWTLGPGVQILGADCVNGRWVISASGLETARCPDCDLPSAFRHGWYVRHLQDLPVQGTAVTLQVRLARWQCRNRRCQRRTFAERLPGIARSFGRRTCRAAELGRLVGHAAGGRPAERLMTRLGLPQSADTILRNLKRHAADRREGATVRVVGIDDWSWRKGSSYGTIMVDLERREVVDVLSERSAEATARWLSQHTKVEIVSRDRCGLYAEGTRLGAPQARQVADRFHLIQNLRQTIEQQLSRAPPPAGQPAATDATAGLRAEATCGGHGLQPELAKHRQLSQEGRRTVRKDMFDRVKILQVAGMGSARSSVRLASIGALSRSGRVSANSQSETSWLRSRPRRATFRTTSRGAGRRDAPRAGICCRRSNV
ncbi:MAG: ISL3 family transposase [Methylocella sp.]